MDTAKLFTAIVVYDKEVPLMSVSDSLPLISFSVHLGENQVWGEKINK